MRSNVVSIDKHFKGNKTELFENHYDFFNFMYKFDKRILKRIEDAYSNKRNKSSDDSLDAYFVEQIKKERTSPTLSIVLTVLSAISFFSSIVTLNNAFIIPTVMSVISACFSWRHFAREENSKSRICKKVLESAGELICIQDSHLIALKYILDKETMIRLISKYEDQTMCNIKVAEILPFVEPFFDDFRYYKAEQKYNALNKSDRVFYYKKEAK